MTNVDVARVNMLSISIKYNISYYYCQIKSNQLTLLDCVWDKDVLCLLQSSMEKKKVRS